jgi:hypothetical protein
VNGPNNPQPQVDASQIEQARRQVNQLADEIARISELELPPAEYYAEFLQRLQLALQAPAGAVWTRTPQGNLVLQCQSSMREVGIDRTPQDRAMHDELLRQAAMQGKAGIVPPSTSRGLEGENLVAGNPTPYVILLAPIVYEKEVVGLVEIWQDPTRPPQAQQGYLNFLLRMAGYASGYTRNHRLRQMTGQQTLWVQLEAFARQIHASLNPTEVSYWIANEGRRLIESDRISVGVRTGRKVDVLAVSGADVVEKRSNLVQRMRALFEAVIDWGEKLVYTGTKDESLPPAVLEALDRYLAESNSQVLVVMPLRDEREKDTHRKVRNALLLESFEPKVSPQVLVERLEVVAKHAGPALYNAVEYRRIPMRFLWLPLAYVQEGLGGKAKAITSLVIVGLTVLVLAMVFVPYPLRMSANGQVLPVERRWLYAPWPGQVVDVKQSLASGSPVIAGQELIDMYDTSLAKMVRDLQVEIQTAEQTISRRVPTAPDGSEDRQAALEKRNAENVKRAKLDELMKIRDLYNASMMNPGFFSVRSPLTGRILNADFRESLFHKKVQPNEPLIRIGATDPKNPRLSEWEIELKIPQKHIGQVNRAFETLNVKELDVDILVMMAPTDVYKGKLRKDKIALQANPNKDSHDEPEPVVQAFVRISGDDIPKESRLPTTLLVTGTEVHSRIRCGDHAMGYSLLYGVWEFLFEKVIFYFWP